MPDVANDQRLLPPMTQRLRREIVDANQIHMVLSAYYDPLVIRPCERDGRHFRQGADLRLVVTDDCGKIIGIKPVASAEHDRSRTPALDRSPRRRHRRGGSGTRMPTSMAELLDRLATLGATHRRRGRHWCITLPNGRMVVLPHTASDWRSLANCVTKLRRAGLDVRRR